MAVLTVILFHVAAWVPGGFVGVDVFFVISGFLITGQIAAELDDRRFSFAAFWSRRVRRIWPAAFAVTCAVLVAGWFLMVPKDYATAAGDAVAQSLMLANVHLWRNVAQGYFAPSSDVRPLLHMWSLGVEEQFYLFFPLVMTLFWRYGRTRCAWLLGILALSSFVLSAAWLPTQPKAVFYLLPFRAWELLLGSLVALLSPGLRMAPDDLPGLQEPAAESVGGQAIASRPALPALLGDGGSLLGLAMILGSCFAYGKNTAFPAAAAVPPCLGAALIIAARTGHPSREPLVNRLLALQPLPMIGKCSYSLYLWHWPVLALLRSCIGEPPVFWLVAAMIAVVPASYLSWRWIEQPFRIGSGSQEPRTTSSAGAIAAWRPVLVGAIAWLSLCAAGATIVRWNGIPSRFSDVERQFLSSSRFQPNKERFLTLGFRERYRILDHQLPAVEDSDALPRIGAESVAGAPHFLLWGDSHGLAISGVVDAVARRNGVCGHAALMGGTVPLPGIWNGNSPRDRRVCDTWSRMVTDWIRVHRPRHVLVCGNWLAYRHVQYLDEREKRASRCVDVLRHGLEQLLRECDACDARVTLLLQVPKQDLLPGQRVVRAHCLGQAIDLVGIDHVKLDEQQADIGAAIANVASDGLHVLNLADPFYEPDGTSRVGDGNGSWYSDLDHVSGYGAERLFVPMLSDWMQMIAGRRGDDDEAKLPLGFPDGSADLVPPPRRGH